MKKLYFLWVYPFYRGMMDKRLEGHKWYSEVAPEPGVIYKWPEIVDRSGVRRVWKAEYIFSQQKIAECNKIS